MIENRETTNGQANNNRPEHTSSMRILIIEDDLEAADWLSKGLQESGHIIDHASDGETGLALATSEQYDVLIIDRMLPKMDGLEIIRNIREQSIKTPILILSALSEVDEKVEGLRAGGDDYLAKPYAFAELLARVEGLARRPDVEPQQTVLVAGDLEMDLLSRKVKRAGHEILLQPREFKLLEYLMRNADKVVTRTMLLENVWNYHFDPQTNVIDVHISRLRGKIDKEFDRPILETIRGAGYMIRAHQP
ncbi:response regulator in two-component regulatory system with PhoQ [hydrothermal vent metagenome]|uniref:Response regulator in two-component regulatory system with PhoQ n=1 Tax=hydrothermal vent metagenome TaxID=652676 RepID=A0A3B0S2S7_9ZZZZ